MRRLDSIRALFLTSIVGVGPSCVESGTVPQRILGAWECSFSIEDERWDQIYYARTIYSANGQVSSTGQGSLTFHNSDDTLFWLSRATGRFEVIDGRTLRSTTTSTAELAGHEGFTGYNDADMDEIHVALLEGVSNSDAATYDFEIITLTPNTLRTTNLQNGGIWDCVRSREDQP